MVLGGTSEEAEHGCSPSDEPQGDAGEGFHTWGELGLGYQGDQETTSGISLCGTQGVTSSMGPVEEKKANPFSLSFYTCIRNAYTITILSK